MLGKISPGLNIIGLTFLCTGTQMLHAFDIEQIFRAHVISPTPFTLVASPFEKRMLF
jgi:predicted phosphatase